MNERIMTFIDATNVLATFGKKNKIEIKPDKTDNETLKKVANLIINLQSNFRGDYIWIRSYWFGSYTGNTPDEVNLRENIRLLGFEPVFFKRNNGKEKRVDIAVAREMLIHAFNRNYDIAWLIAGDEDYVDLVYDLKRLGVRVMGSFFDDGLSPDLKLSFDLFHKIL